MKLHLQLISLAALVLLCLLSCIHAKEDVGANVNVDADANGKPEAWLISFHDTAETSKFEAVTKWLGEKSCPISESINESYIKFLVANMTAEHVKELEAKKDEFAIETIELDDLVWDSMNKSEL